MPLSPRVECVVVNWKRPQNVAKIVRALKSQSVPVVVTIVDCSPAPEFDLTDEVKRAADEYYFVRQNHLAASRYIPMFQYVREFTFFIDDDMLPGRDCVAHFLDYADQHPEAGVLGQIGRNIGDEYEPIDVTRLPDRPVEVDLVVRGYFVRREIFPELLLLRHCLLTSEVREDDMLLAWAVRSRRMKSILTPKEGPETEMNAIELPDPHALHHNPEHAAKRTQFWQRIRGY